MATYTTMEDTVAGNMRVTMGKYETVNGAGTINTGLTQCLMMMLTPATIDLVASITSSLPCDGSAVGIDTEGSSDGYWVAWGY